ncbi:glutamate-ammonia-ligase adenylyltransferase/molybdopterin synthase catalytic subunit [Polaromonas sp. YR568]|nr:glutamate-ammonia-ligase adenylyltransferase/molybdopterin synthase catalytic subunit [Polaromonas sp. YR568]
MTKAPTLFTSCNALPPEGAVLAWGGPALRTVALPAEDEL